MDLPILLERCRRGDELAWETLVRRFQSRVYSIAYHYSGNAEDAGDWAQETFVRLYQNMGMAIEAGSFVPWLVRMTRNVCIDHLRRRKSRPPAHDIPAEDVPGLTSHEPTPEEQWFGDADKRLVHRALQSMTELNREIILLKEIQGLPLQEIASLLKVPLGTVKSRSDRARLELARKVLALSNEPVGYVAS